MRSINAEIDIVFTTSHAEFALDAYEIYPLDYMVKPISRIRLARTIERALNSRNPSNESLGDLSSDRLMVKSSGATQSFEAPVPSTPLTLREIEVLRCIAVGWSNEEIAERLQISLSTVKVHIRHVFAKLEVHNRVSAVTRAQHLSLLE
jgi:DNA-binding NarL/FixJ family response regulator